MLDTASWHLAKSCLHRGGYTERKTQCNLTVEGNLLGSDGIRLDSTGDMRLADGLKTHSSGSGRFKVTLPHNAL